MAFSSWMAYIFPSEKNTITKAGWKLPKHCSLSCKAKTKKKTLGDKKGKFEILKIIWFTSFENKWSLSPMLQENSAIIVNAHFSNWSDQPSSSKQVAEIIIIINLILMLMILATKAVV